MLKKVIFGLIAIVLVGIAYIWVNKVEVVGELVDPLTYFDEFKNNTNNLVYKDERIDLEEPVTEIDGNLYVTYRFANSYVSDTIFYDITEKVMTLTNAKEVVKLYPNSENEITFLGIEGKYPLKEKDGHLYVSVKLLEDFFKVRIEPGKDGRLFIAYDDREEQVQAKISRRTSLRTHARKKSTVVEKLSKGTMVTIYGEENGFLRVRSENGIIGYVPVAHIKNKTTIEALEVPSQEPWPINPLNQKVKLAWDQMTTAQTGNWSSSKYAHVDKLNVISPTWFEFGDEEGTLVDRGTREYVKSAHDRGLQVWPIISHNFTNTGLTKEILSSTKKRQYVIEQIIDKAKIYGFDGINVDIENIQNETSAVWVQFMRELYPKLKAEGIIVSVDVYMPSNWSGHYEREKVAAVSDYFIVMAYDQHWSGSEEPGSVSEISWVDEGIKRTLQEVPKEKLVLGIPFYTRLWTQTSEGLSSVPYGMTSAKQLIDKWGVTPQLDTASGQNYAEVQKDNETYKLWIEDYSSISKRIAIMDKYKLAGYGAWKLGLESSDIWEVLGEVK